MTLEALLALADEMVRAVGRRDVAHDVGDRADAVQVVGLGLARPRVALHEDADLALLAHRLLRGGDRPGRPTAIGSTTPGNSTVSRTGTMMSASAGSGGTPASPPRRRRSASAAEARGGAMSIVMSMVIGSRPFRALTSEAAVAAKCGGPCVAAGRQRHAALETALRQLEPVNDGGAQLGRQRAAPATTSTPSSITTSTRSGSTPGSATSTRTSRSVSSMSAGGSQTGCRRAGQLEELPVQALRARQHLAGFRPHPVFLISRYHVSSRRRHSPLDRMRAARLQRPVHPTSPVTLGRSEAETRGPRKLALDRAHVVTGSSGPAGAGPRMTLPGRDAGIAEILAATAPARRGSRSGRCPGFLLAHQALEVVDAAVHALHRRRRDRAGNARPAPCRARSCRSAHVVDVGQPLDRARRLFQRGDVARGAAPPACPRRRSTSGSSGSIWISISACARRIRGGSPPRAGRRPRAPRRAAARRPPPGRAPAPAGRPDAAR